MPIYVTKETGGSISPELLLKIEELEKGAVDLKKELDANTAYDKQQDIMSYVNGGER